MLWYFFENEHFGAFCIIDFECALLWYICEKMECDIFFNVTLLRYFVTLLSLRVTQARAGRPLGRGSFATPPGCAVSRAAPRRCRRTCDAVPHPDRDTLARHRTEAVRWDWRRRPHQISFKDARLGDRGRAYQEYLLVFFVGRHLF